MSEQGSSGKGSFADRFGSNKKSFTSQKVDGSSKEPAATNSQEPQPNQIPQQNQKQFSDKIQQNKINKKPIDLQKKMQADLIYLVKGLDAGRKAWYYVLVERPKVQIFLKALNDDIIHLDQYGQILYSAYGEEPPVEVTDKLKDEYGIN
jgi:hypothetical protein